MGRVCTMTNGDRKKAGKNNFVTIDVADLEHGPIVIDCALPLEWIRARMTFCEYEAMPLNASTKLNVQMSGAGIWVRGRVFANVKTQCALCLKDIVLGIESTVNSYLLPIGEYKKDIGKNELTPEDLDREYYDGEAVCLDDMLGDAIMLELPMNPKCGATCPGTAAYSDTPTMPAPSIDSRLKPLLEIRLNKEN
jgi:uncharacterized metal-binding protein YceD (DUF177 family)